MLTDFKKKKEKKKNKQLSLLASVLSGKIFPHGFDKIRSLDYLFS